VPPRLRRQHLERRERAASEARRASP
jgi:hypothetical protein